MDEKIKVQFIREGTNVKMRVLEMPEIYRGAGALSIRGFYKIISSEHPQISRYELNLRGTNLNGDNRWSEFDYELESDAEYAVNTFSTMIFRLNENCNGNYFHSESGAFVRIAE